MTIVPGLIWPARLFRRARGRTPSVIVGRGVSAGDTRGVEKVPIEDRKIDSNRALIGEGTHTCSSW